MGKSLVRSLRAISIGVFLLASLLAAGNASAVTHTTLFVANAGTSHDTPGFGTNQSCSHAYLTISYAIGQASPGDTVLVCAGTYDEPVTIDKSLTLQGRGNAILDPGITGIAVTVASDNVTVRGLTVQNSFAGIDVENSDHTRLVGNIARTSIFGINIENSSYSLVTGNAISDNLCVGIAVYALGLDRTSHNAITGNRVDGNVTARCLMPEEGLTVRLTGLPAGILLGSENGGKTFGNVVARNAVLGNGTSSALPGAGVILEDPFGITFNGSPPRQVAAAQPGVVVPGGGTFGNQVLGNRISGNGLPGVTLLNPGRTANLNGNTILQNTIGTNNFRGLRFDRRTTGVYAASARPLIVQISGNAIIGDFYGVWLNPLVPAQYALFNQFIYVPVPIFVGSA